MIKWIIVVTFGMSSISANDPAVFTKTPHAQRVFTQAITDTQGRIVWFDTKEQCRPIAVKVIDKMLEDPGVVPKYARCIQATIEE